MRVDERTLEVVGPFSTDDASPNFHACFATPQEVRDRAQVRRRSGLLLFHRRHGVEI
jgi:hypothetical protein